jgi:hypothetical protein
MVYIKNFQNEKFVFENDEKVTYVDRINFATSYDSMKIAKQDILDLNLNDDHVIVNSNAIPC